MTMTTFSGDYLNRLYKKYTGAREIGSKFSDVFKAVFPEAVESKYTELAELLWQYFGSANQLRDEILQIETLDSESAPYTLPSFPTANLDELIRTLTSVRNNINAGKGIALQEVDKLSTSFASINSTLCNYSKDFADMSNTIRTRDTLGQSAEGNQKKCMDLVPDIESKLREIVALRIGDSEDRLDRIQINGNRHLAVIYNIEGLQPEVKHALVTLLCSYVSLRISAFKSLVEYANEVCSNHKEGEIFFSDEIFANIILTCSQEDLSESFEKISSGLIMASDDSERLSQTIKDNEALIQVMDWCNSYITGDVAHIDFDLISKMRWVDKNSIPDATIGTLLKNLNAFKDRLDFGRCHPHN